MRIEKTVKLAGFVGMALLTASASAALYPTVESSTEWVDATDTRNWTKTKGVDDPPADEELRNGSHSLEIEQALFLDLKGETLKVSYIRNMGSYWGDSSHPWAFTNGTLRILRELCDRHKTTGIEILDGATIDIGYGYGPGNYLGESAACPLWIRKGGVLKADEYAPYNGKLYIESGGTFETRRLTPVAGSQQPYNRCENRGTARFIEGMTFVKGIHTADGRLGNGTGDGGTGYKFTFVQAGGDLWTGGDVSRGEAVNAAYEFVFSGGTIHAEGPSFGFYNGVVASVPDGSTVGLEMPAGSTADFSSVTFGENTTLVLAGDIDVLFGETRPTVVKYGCYVYEGVPASPVVGCGGFRLTLAAPLLSLDNLTLPEDWTLVLDQAAFTEGSVVARSSDREFLETVHGKLSADLYASYPDMTLSLDGDTITLVGREVSGTTYYWNCGERGDRVCGSVADLANWSTAWDAAAVKPSTDAVPTRLPTYVDTLCVTRDLVWDLGGRTMCVKGMNVTPYPYASGMYWGSSYDTWSISNGTLCVKENIITRHKGRIDGDVLSSFDICNGGKLVHGAESADDVRFSLGNGNADRDYGAARLRIFPGGEADIRSMMRFYCGQVEIMKGGRFKLSRIAFESSSEQPNVLENHGTCVFPNGLVMAEGLGPASSGAASLEYRQCGGTMTLGGNVATNDRPGTVTFELSGGTLEATGDVAFRVHSATVSAGSAVTVKVAADRLMDMTGFTYGEGAVITKTGAGRVAFDPQAYPSSLVVKEGFLALTRPETTVPATATFGPGGGLHFAASGTVIPALPNAAEMSFTVDTEVLAEGDVIATCSDAGTLSAVRDTLNDAWIAIDPKRGYLAEIAGDSLVLCKRRKGTVIVVR